MVSDSLLRIKGWRVVEHRESQISDRVVSYDGYKTQSKSNDNTPKKRFRIEESVEDMQINSVVSGSYGDSKTTSPSAQASPTPLQVNQFVSQVSPDSKPRNWMSGREFVLSDGKSTDQREMPVRNIELNDKVTPVQQSLGRESAIRNGNSHVEARVDFVPISAINPYSKRYVQCVIK